MKVDGDVYGHAQQIEGLRVGVKHLLLYGSMEMERQGKGGSEEHLRQHRMKETKADA